MFHFFSTPAPLRLNQNFISFPHQFKRALITLLICALVIVLFLVASVHKIPSNEFSNADLRTKRFLSVFNSSGGRSKSQVKRETVETSNEVGEIESNDKIRNFDKILCYVLLSRRKLVAANVIKTTWGKHCDKLIFYGRFNNSELPVTFLNATEGYDYLWGKTKSALVHLDTHFSMHYAWFMKADDDTFVVLENLQDYIQELNLDAQKPTWFGYKLKHNRMQEGYMSGGAGYVFSTSALSKVVRLLKTGHVDDPIPQKGPERKAGGMCDVRGSKGVEDLELGKCFFEAGVEDVSTADLQGRERFLPLPLNSLLNGDITSFHWIWRQAWNPLKIGPITALTPYRVRVRQTVCKSYDSSKHQESQRPL